MCVYTYIYIYISMCVDIYRVNPYPHSASLPSFVGVPVLISLRLARTLL